MDETQYLFGKRVPGHILRYSPSQIANAPVHAPTHTLLDETQTPLEHLKEYLAMHNLLSYPVNIEYILHDTGVAYFDIRLNNLN